MSPDDYFDKLDSSIQDISLELRRILFTISLDYYVEGFKTKDLNLIDKRAQYTIAYIKGGTADA